MPGSGRVMDASLSQALQHQLNCWQKFAPCLGSNVTIIDGRHGVWSGAAGRREMEADAPMQPGARFYIYSITKTFVAARLLQLGIELNAPVTAYLRDLTLPDEITVRHLLNHTAGVPSYTDLADYVPAVFQSPGKPWQPGEVIQRCCGGKIDFPPGEGWHYSNTGYMLLAQTIEAVSGKTLSVTMADGILTPLGLNRTYVAEAVDAGLATPGYARQLSADEAMINVVQIYHPGWCLTGLMVSTTDEVARFFETLMSGRLPRSPLLSEMLTPVWTGGAAGPFFRRPSSGLGVMIDPDFGHGGLFGHGGDGPGANSWVMYLPDFCGRELTLAVLCNTSMGGIPSIWLKIYSGCWVRSDSLSSIKSSASPSPFRSSRN